jgi:glycosyltransferase involved in cell wall biosynthesis
MKKTVRTDTAFIIPAYNESEVIVSVISSLSNKFKYIVCVNDGSTDDTSAKLHSTKAHVIDHPINMGQGAALQTGIEFARQLPVNYFVTFDADGQHRLKDAEAMVKELESNKFDIVLGSRFLGSTIGMKKSKERILKLAIQFSNFTSGVKLTDTHNGLRAFNRHVAETMQITMPDMTHASEILEIISAQKYRYKEIPVTIEYTEYSRAKGQSLINAVNISFDTILRKLTK